MPVRLHLSRDVALDVVLRHELGRDPLAFVGVLRLDRDEERRAEAVVLHHAPDAFEIRRRVRRERARAAENEKQTCDRETPHADSGTLLRAPNTVRRTPDLVIAIASSRLPDLARSRRVRARGALTEFR
jgi:hypothetical protein